MRSNNRPWTRDETLVALGLYLQLPYGKLDHRTKEIVVLAKALNRTSSSLSMKMCNIGRLDPSLKDKGTVGLGHGAKLEREIWDEFAGRHEELIENYETIISSLVGKSNTCDEDAVIKTPQGLDGVRLQKYRINQSFFRRSVLASYDERCCISGISDPRLLVASHIKPWAACENGDERTDVCNGLCLSPLYDRAFDIGLFTIDEDYRVVLSKSLQTKLTHEVYVDNFSKYEQCEISLPSRCIPSQNFLEYHRSHVFKA